MVNTLKNKIDLLKINSVSFLIFMLLIFMLLLSQVRNEYLHIAYTHIYTNKQIYRFHKLQIPVKSGYLSIGIKGELKILKIKS